MALARLCRWDKYQNVIDWIVCVCRNRSHLLSNMLWTTETQALANKATVWEKRSSNGKIFEGKIDIYIWPINLNICLRCSKEPSHWDGYFEYLHHIFWLWNKKNNWQLRPLIWKTASWSYTSQECEATFSIHRWKFPQSKIWRFRYSNPKKSNVQIYEAYMNQQITWKSNCETLRLIKLTSFRIFGLTFCPKILNSDINL